MLSYVLQSLARRSLSKYPDRSRAPLYKPFRSSRKEHNRPIESSDQNSRNALLQHLWLYARFRLTYHFRSGLLLASGPASSLSDIRNPKMDRLGEALLKVRAFAAAGDIDSLLAELDNPLERGRVVIRAAAADYLGELHAERAVEPLAKLLQSDPNEHVRTLAVRALGEIGTNDTLEPLLDALDDPGEAVRTWAILSLGKPANHAAVPALIERLQDNSWSMRRVAAEALVRVGDGSAIEALKAARARERSLLRKLRLAHAVRQLNRTA